MGHAHLVWLPRATSSSLLLMNLMDVYASILPTVANNQVIISRNIFMEGMSLHLSQLTSARMRSPTLPPELRYVTAKDTNQ